MGLDLTDQNLLGLAVDRQVDSVCAPGLDEDPLEFEPVERDRDRFCVVPIADGRHLALAEQTARAFAEWLAGQCLQFHSCASGWRGPHMIRQPCDTPRPRTSPTPGFGSSPD